MIYLSGICGFIGDGDDKLLKKMLKSINHRGGEEKILMFDNCGLGVTAASINKSRSFGFNDEGSICNILDGNLFNKEKLINLINASYDIDHLTDSEVICFLFEKFGSEFIDK